MNKSIFVCVFVGLMGARMGYGMTSVIPEGTPDLKPMALEAMGLREAGAVSAKEICVVVGPSVTDVMYRANAWRILSEEDGAYAYEKFVRPVGVVKGAVVKEFEVPEGYTAPNAASQKELGYRVVRLELPEGMKEGCRYSVVAMGDDSMMVTAAKTAASFVYRAGEERAESAFPSEAVKGLAASMIGLRTVRSVGDGMLLVEYGAGYSEAGGNELSNWEVRVNGVRRAVKGLGRRSVLDCYLPVGWPFRVFRSHEIFLNIGESLKTGDVVEVKAAPAVGCGADEARMVFDETKSLSLSIKVNQAGYVPWGVKSARLGCWLGSYPDKGAILPVEGGVVEKRAPSAADVFGGGDEEEAGAVAESGVSAYRSHLAENALSFDAAPEFEVRKVEGDAVVFRGVAKLLVAGNQEDGKVNHSGENVFELDFTEFREPGRYYLSVPGVGRSLEFAIGEDAFKGAFELAAYGLFAQRCGQELKAPYSDWHRIACHKKGVTVSTLRRYEHHEFGKFEENLVYEDKAAEVPADLKAAWGRESLVAYYPLEGNGANAVKGACTDLVPVEGGVPKYKEDGSVSGKSDSKVYTTGREANGLCGKVALEAERGATLSFWMKREDVSGIKYGGDAVRLAAREKNARGEEVGFNVNWGVLRMMGGDGWKRVGDGKWHSYTFVVPPVAADAEGQDRRVKAVMYADGEMAMEGAFTWPKETGAMDFRLGCVTDEGAEGSSFDEVRLYGEALPLDVVKALAQCVPDKVPRVLQTFGGHHDAGDYNPRCHMDVAFTLMNAYELAPQKFTDGQLNIPEAGNGVPDVVDEALWALRVWHGLYDPATGAVYNGTESAGDPNFIQTVEMDNKGDYAWAPDSQGALQYAAACAQAARIVGAQTGPGAKMVERAKKAYAWGVANRPDTTDVRTFGRFYTCPLAHAAAELYHTTGDAQYHDDFVANTPWKKRADAEVIASNGSYDLSLAAYAYMQVPAAKCDAAVRESVLQGIRKEADMYLHGSDMMGYKFVRHPYAPATWGTGAHPNFIMPVLNLAFVDPDAGRRERYREWLIRTADNSLGCNPMGTAWTVGIGPRTVRAPLHNSRYSPAGMPVRGQQAQGPSQRGNGYNFVDTLYPKFSESHAVLRSFADCSFAIAMDEGTVPHQAKTVALFGVLLPDAEPAKAAK